jgi:hypothetical protein
MASRRKPSDVEVALFWAAASIPPPPTIRELATSADVDSVLEAAARHRVLTIVVRALIDAGIDIPKWALSESRGWEARARLAIPAAATSALDALEEGGLRPLVLKGLSMARRYEPASLRPMDDLDVFLPRTDHERARDVLERAGWRRAGHVGRAPGYDVAFVNSSMPGVPLEIHHEIARWADRPRRMTGEWLWNRRMPGTVFDRPVWELDPTVELLVNVVHTAKAFHLFDRTIWTVDAALLIREGRIDWDAFLRLAVWAERRTASAIALRLAQRAGAEVPADLLRLPPSLERSGALRSLLDPAAPFETARYRRWLAYALVDGLRGRLRCSLGDLAKPMGLQTRSEVVRDIAELVARGVPALARGPGRDATPR